MVAWTSTKIMNKREDHFNPLKLFCRVFHRSLLVCYVGCVLAYVAANFHPILKRMRSFWMSCMRRFAFWYVISMYILFDA